MTSAIWQFAGSLFAVGVMVALAWRIGFSGVPVLADETEARSFAHGLPGGFSIEAVILDAHGHAALLQDESGRIAIVMAHGAHFLARLVRAPADAHVDGDTLTLHVGSRHTRLEIGHAAARNWAEAINRARIECDAAL